MRSVLAQTHADWSLVSSTTGPPTRLPPWRPDSRTTGSALIRQANAGVSAARNAGLATCAGSSAGTAVLPDAVLFLDGDDWLAADALATLADTL